MKRIFPIALTAIAIMVLSAVPMLYARPNQRGGRSDNALSMLLKARAELGLSEAQTTEIRSIMKSLHDQNASLRTQRRDYTEDAIDTLVADPSAVVKAQTLIDQKAKIDRTRQTNLVNATAKALRVLSPDQRQRLAELIEERRGARVSSPAH